jgi:hypothetical protein
MRNCLAVAQIEELLSKGLATDESMVKLLAVNGSTSLIAIKLLQYLEGYHWMHGCTPHRERKMNERSISYSAYNY